MPQKLSWPPLYNIFCTDHEHGSKSLRNKLWAELAMRLGIASSRVAKTSGGGGGGGAAEYSFVIKR